MAKYKVPIFGTVGKTIFVDPKATEGAVIGTNLALPDGSVPTFEELAELFAPTPVVPPTGDLATTTWELIGHLPTMIEDIAALTDPGADTLLGWDDSASGVINFTLGAGILHAATSLSIDHDAAVNFVADEHIAHSGVTLTAGAGLTGGGDIAASRSFAVGAGTGITVNADDVALSAATIASLALADSALQDITAESILDLADVPADPGADAFLMWDDSATATAWITEIPDSFLSSNVALKNGNETITGEWTFSDTLNLSSAAPVVFFLETDAALDEKQTRFGQDGGNFFIQSLTDAGAFGSNAIVGRRNGTTWSFLDLSANRIRLSGTVGLDSANQEIQFGAGGNDLQISSDGTNGVIAGTGLKIGANNLGFYGTTPIAQQTGVAVDAASIHAALVNLGLITA